MKADGRDIEYKYIPKTTRKISTDFLEVVKSVTLKSFLDM
jgi:hypothetical protein